MSSVLHIWTTYYYRARILTHFFFFPTHPLLMLRHSPQVKPETIVISCSYSWKSSQNVGVREFGKTCDQINTPVIAITNCYQATGGQDFLHIMPFRILAHSLLLHSLEWRDSSAFSLAKYTAQLKSNVQHFGCLARPSQNPEKIS